MRTDVIIEKKCLGGGVLARFHKPGGGGFEFLFCPGGGELAHQKNAQGFCPGGVVSLGID